MNSTSLLAQLYPYFKGSQEDVATASLRYIVSSDPILNNAFTRLISEKLHLTIEKELQYECQITGQSDEAERPDMSAFDSNGDEILLCESKFYAALTSNQPKTYIKRLIQKKGAGLIFICPELRLKSLWSEVRLRAEEAYTVNEIADDCVDANGIHMGIVSWRELIDSLSDAALKNNVNQMDIMQLKGYCEKLDSEAFIPFNEMDLGIENAIKQERHVILIDALFDALKADDRVDVSIGSGRNTLHATPQKTGYARYFLLNGYGAALVIDTVKWKNPDSFITPYWLKLSSVVGNKWKVDEHCKNALRRIPNEKKDGDFMALEAKCYVTLDEIVKSMENQVIDYLKEFERNKGKTSDI